jgi:hypothetical protein
VKRQPSGPATREWWTPERREAARALWDLERRSQEALKRLDKPQGNRSKDYWTAEKRAEHSARMRRRRGGLGELKEIFRELDAIKERLRRRGDL